MTIQAKHIPLLAIFAVVGAGIWLFIRGPFGMESIRSVSDYLYLGIVACHGAWALIRILRPEKNTRVPDLLFGLSLIFFLFSYIFATNANMDYVQRFAAESENLRLAPDSRTERLNSLLRFGPLLLADIAAIVYYRVLEARRSGMRTAAAAVRMFSLPLTLLSSFLYTLALPSFLSTTGLGFIGFFCLVPLFVVMVFETGWRPVFYGTLFGVVQTMLSNFWLGTFSLVSLQLVTVVYLIFFALFMVIVTTFLKRMPRHGILLVPALWVVFDLARSLGFTGYPWAMLGVSQYLNLPLIQLSSATGIWGVSFVLLLANATIAFCLQEYLSPRGSGPRLHRAGISVLTYAFLYTAIVTGGRISMAVEQSRQNEQSVHTVGLVQQNTDPRKDDYREGLTVLQSLTDEAMAYNPELVVWSETAFVPNIRRWSAMDPARYYYSRLVNEFLEYQKSLDTWLITGNDDYELIPVEGAEDERNDYNASVFFDPEGNRVETYRKLHLVPFTEYFPWKKSMPKFYELLKEFDVYLWEPGNRRVVFEHPSFRFSTPICFEDGFPGDVRKFVQAGADVIINISNDYWSLSDVEAQQHYANSLFRAVENRRHLLRASASGVTCSIDSTGQLVDRLPLYEEGYLIAQVSRGHGRMTWYTRFGDWFPVAAGILALFIFVGSFWRKR